MKKKNQILALDTIEEQIEEIAQEDEIETNFIVLEPAPNIENAYESEDNFWSDQENINDLITTESVLNIDNIIEALEKIPNDLIAPSQSRDENITKIAPDIYISSLTESARSSISEVSDIDFISKFDFGEDILAKLIESENCNK